MRVRFYSGPERERLHPEGVDMPFGGGSFFIRPEAAATLAHGLVQRDRETGRYRRVQLTQCEERMIIEEARGRAAAIVDRDEPTPWSSGRTPFSQASVSPPQTKR
ncbi:hypothetical protein [Reyranella sp.]|uniref:hypothetical protein n=1 Tax=Reyranella sp. TaxID=1929291 RepID=UPI0012201B20|nr:hypothetical protein [Reyranella sp.]TAJ89439.1 MAG: hypothetical protein EPO50_03475 [Reyranella sp.]